MMLTLEEVELMKKVRENMQRRYEAGTFQDAPYICWNIIEAVVGRNTMYDGPDLIEQLHELGGMAERLHRHISWALGDSVTVGGFIRKNTEHLGFEYSIFAGKFDAEARLAWLDRIIEMRNIQ